MYICLAMHFCEILDLGKASHIILKQLPAACIQDFMITTRHCVAERKAACVYLDSRFLIIVNNIFYSG